MRFFENKGFFPQIKFLIKIHPTKKENKTITYYLLLKHYFKI